MNRKFGWQGLINRNKKKINKINKCASSIVSFFLQNQINLYVYILFCTSFLCTLSSLLKKNVEKKKKFTGMEEEVEEEGGGKGVLFLLRWTNLPLKSFSHFQAKLELVYRKTGRG